MSENEILILNYLKPLTNEIHISMLFEGLLLSKEQFYQAFFVLNRDNYVFVNAFSEGWMNQKDLYKQKVSITTKGSDYLNALETQTSKTIIVHGGNSGNINQLEGFRDFNNKATIMPTEEHTINPPYVNPVGSFKKFVKWLIANMWSLLIGIIGSIIAAIIYSRYH